MMHFIQKLRELSEGKPVGFKLCIGQPLAIYEHCQSHAAYSNYS